MCAGCCGRPVAYRFSSRTRGSAPGTGRTASSGPVRGPDGDRGRWPGRGGQGPGWGKNASFLCSPGYRLQAPRRAEGARKPPQGLIKSDNSLVEHGCSAGCPG
ncbi:hypothetical protein GCM10009716_25560 [Streptomyces sodiiphilus]|uniref:Uncharacterized protein n=1 Tax=Streptomyces sodiiphilus TaxID=226217 RepID=A0ABN2P9T8_9ACTN